LILKANLAAAALFGVDRRDLINKPLRTFIASESWAVFADFRKTLLKTLTKQLCEVKLLRRGNPLAHVLIEGLDTSSIRSSPPNVPGPGWDLPSRTGS
jgi:hypothetical protein